MKAIVKHTVFFLLPKRGKETKNDTKTEQKPTKTQKRKNIFNFFAKTLAQFRFLIYFCNVKTERPHSLTQKHLWRGGRVVDCTGLENRRTERYRGFESLPLRRKRFNKLKNNELNRFSF